MTFALLPESTWKWSLKGGYWGFEVFLKNNIYLSLLFVNELKNEKIEKMKKWRQRAEEVVAAWAAVNGAPCVARRDIYL